MSWLADTFNFLSTRIMRTADESGKHNVSAYQETLPQPATRQVSIKQANTDKEIL